MTGAELQSHRKAAGLSQIALARLAGVGRHAVQYWERKPVVRPWQHAPRQMLTALGLPHFATRIARAQAWGLTPAEDWWERIDREAKARAAERARARAARTRVPCGAQTRQGHPCKLLSEPGRRRCKFHGGRSTGPRTAEGRARIAEAQRRRWAARRALGTGP